MELAIPLALLGMFSITCNDEDDRSSENNNKNNATNAIEFDNYGDARAVIASLNTPETNQANEVEAYTNMATNKRSKWAPKPMPSGRAPNQGILDKQSWVNRNKMQKNVHTATADHFNRTVDQSAAPNNTTEFVSDGVYTAPLTYHNNFAQNMNGPGNKEAPNLNGSEHTLSSRNGYGKETRIDVNQKRTAPLFSYTADSDFYHTLNNGQLSYEMDEERVVTSNLHHDKSSVEQVRDGPTDMASGFNHGMNSVRADEVRNVDDMRTLINHKETNVISGLEGAPSALVKAGVSEATVGTGELYKPDNSVIKTVADWFGGGGIEVAPAHQSEYVQTNLRREGTEGSYMGPAINTYLHDSAISQLPAYYNQSKRNGVLMSQSGVGPISATGYSDAGDRIDAIASGAAETKRSDYSASGDTMLGAMYNATVGALLAPLGPSTNVSKPTHRAELAETTRLGNLNAPMKHAMGDRNAIVKPTMRELTILNESGGTGFIGVREQPYVANVTPLPPTQRESAITSYIGGAGGGVFTAETNYDADRNTVPKNNNRGISASEYRAGGNRETFNPDAPATQQFKQSQRADVSPNDGWLPPAQVSDINPADTSEIDRGGIYNLRRHEVPDQSSMIDPQLFEALQNNPYTHSISYQK